GIHAQWKELGSQRQRGDYPAKTAAIEAAIKYYDPTDSRKQIAKENERLRIQRDITRNESRLWEAESGQTPASHTAAPPPRTAVGATGSARVRLESLVSAGEFLAFLDSTEKPDLFSRHENQGKPVTNVSWLEAVRYCNWRSSRAGLEAYYTIHGKSVQTSPGKSGYRLPTREEIGAALDRGVVRQEDLAAMGVLSSDSNSAYCYDRRTRSLRAIDSSLPTGAIGFMVVRNDGK
ncbi:MAG: formylglycine-generating enzyme family protein, partial [Spirochaetaceae bacterium]|nr:formylglycine-generating enzyme family protein [Spirochaetaceae bacterium]